MALIWMVGVLRVIKKDADGWARLSVALHHWVITALYPLAYPLLKEESAEAAISNKKNCPQWQQKCYHYRQ